jgi:hypothetical protein
MAALTAVAILATAAQAAPRNRVVRWTDLTKWAQSDIPRDVRPNARIVGVLGDRTIVVAPTRNGNFCTAFVGHRHHRGWGGCRVRSSSPDNRRGNFHAELVGASYTGEAKRIGGPVLIRTVSGETLAGPGAFLSLVYADRTREPLSTIWVGAPIRAGFYYRALRKPHQSGRGRPTAVELRGRDGRLIARQVFPKPIFRR